MKNLKNIKVSVEYMNPVGMSVIVNKKVSEEELALLEAREDVKVIRVSNKNDVRIA